LGAVQIGTAALRLGAGRRTTDDEIDHSVGIVLRKKRGDEVASGDTVAEFHEVETVRAGLSPRLVGRRFEDVRILDSRLTRPVDPAEVAAELTGERVRAVDRRGKYLIFRFESGLVLLIHLRMTGTLLHSRNGAPAEGHVRAVVRLDDESDVVYRDIRRFGTWLVLRGDELDAYLVARLGREPLESSFSARDLG